MPARKYFGLDILCPSCGAAGTARVSESEEPDTADHAFRVDECPPGFSAENRSATRLETLVTCSSCGQVFYLL